MEDTLTRHRMIEEIIEKLARKHGITKRSFSGGWIHVFQKSGMESKLIGHRWSLNDSAASLIASDKVATYELLADQRIPAIPHTLIRSRGDSAPNFPKILPRAFLIKPLQGTAGQGIVRCENVEEAIQAMNHHDKDEWTLSPYMQIEREVRVILLNNECLLTYEKVSPVTKNGVTFFNLSKGATAKSCLINAEQRQLAIGAAHALGLRLAAVDIVQIKGEWQVLEINDGFMMEHYARQSSENYRATAKLYERVLLASLS